MASTRDNNNESNRLLASVDWFTVLLYVVLVIAGAVSIYAATTSSTSQVSMFDFDTFSGKQFLWIGLSFAIGFSLLLIDRRLYEAYAYPIYAIMIIILIVTAFVSPNIKGSHSWLRFGPVSIQPAEFAKTATALALAKLFSTYGFQLKGWRTYIVPLFIIFLPVACILLERETGSALVYFSLILVLYREGMNGFVLFAMLAAVSYFVIVLKFAATLTMGIPTGIFIVLTCVMVIIVLMLLMYCRSLILGRNVALGYIACALIAWGLTAMGVHINGYVFFFTVIPASLIYLLIGMFHDDLNKVLMTVIFAVASIIFMFSVNVAFNMLATHQQNRINIALGIEEDLKGKGYNVNQSKIAIGSGGLTGKGFLQGTQTKLNYVPEQHTDFIFCTIGEEEGFVGTTTVLILFLTLILRVIAIGERQHTTFGRVYAYCVASILIFHLTINIGMVIGLVPVIGIPLPFFSYGGSSLWGFTILLFILLRIDAVRSEYGTW
ncbi:MAG: rod shape-determining protein RodA [Muribaculaceae bacterium]|nr:rod shape-determining protein RodA [Muribaculaceae bacterium]MBQ5409516.1 rod shape-determining protein RodA [Muribaculaceae bacterium]MDY6294597.1 rod shape-determining protein RodA [Bacteroidales bacterium]